VIDTREGLVKVSESKLERIERVVKRLLSGREKVRVREIAAFAKLVNLVGRTVQPVRWVTRALYHLIGVIIFSREVAFISWKIHRNFERWCVLLVTARAEVKWWSENIREWNGVQLWIGKVLCVITIDTFALGWRVWWKE
jgi:hypothetical protein